MPGWAEALVLVISTGAAAYAAWASWQSVLVARESNATQETWRGEEKKEQKRLRDEERADEEERREERKRWRREEQEERERLQVEDRQYQEERRKEQRGWRQKEQEEQQAWRAVERHYVYYNAIVARPALAGIQEYGQRIREVLDEGEASIRALRDAGSNEDAVQTEVTRLLNEAFAAEHNAMTKVLTEAAEAWPDNDLRVALRDAAEGAAAVVAEEGAKLLDPKGRPNFDAVLNDALGAARRVVMDHDPALKAVASPA